jgi:hypothetical protein
MAKKSSKYWAVAEFSCGAMHLSGTTIYRLLEGGSEKELKHTIRESLTDAIGLDEGSYSNSDEDEEQESEPTNYDVPLIKFTCSDSYSLYSYDARVVLCGKIPDDLGAILTKLKYVFGSYLDDDEDCETPELRDQLKSFTDPKPSDVSKIKQLVLALCEEAEEEGDAQLFI